MGAGATRSNAATTATVTLQVIVTGDNGHVSVSAGDDCDIEQTREGGLCLYSVTAGDQVTLRPATTTDFVGWSVFECPGTSDCTITMDSDRTVVATFTPTSLTVVFEGNDPTETVTSLDGLLSCHPAENCSSGKFPAFAEVTLTAAPAHSFDSWSGACQEARSQPKCTLLLSGDDVVGAKFNDASQDPDIVPPRHDMLLNVVVTPKGSGTVTSNRSRLSQAIDCSPTCQAQFEQGESPTLTAVGLNGGTFVGWRGGGRFCKADSRCHFPAFAITDIEAVFKPAGCVVPRVVGLRLKKAKQRISKALCSTGKVTRKPSSLRKKGRVLAQNPRPHTKLNKGARVKLVVGRGRS